MILDSLRVFLNIMGHTLKKNNEIVTACGWLLNGLVNDGRASASMSCGISVDDLDSHPIGR
jgi:hypothetical protein